VTFRDYIRFINYSTKIREEETDRDKIPLDIILKAGKTT